MVTSTAVKEEKKELDENEKNKFDFKATRRAAALATEEELDAAEAKKRRKDAKHAAAAALVTLPTLINTKKHSDLATSPHYNK